MTPEFLMLWMLATTLAVVLFVHWYVLSIKRDLKRIMAMQSATIAIATMTSQGVKVADERTVAAMERAFEAFGVLNR
jgi:hypothetical protein